MRKWGKRSWLIIGGIFTIIGLGGIPEDIKQWMRWMDLINQTVGQVTMDIVDAINGNAGRWAFTLLGVSILLISYRVPQSLWQKLRHSASPGETEKVSPTIEFVADHALSIGHSERHNVR